MSNIYDLITKSCPNGVALKKLKDLCKLKWRFPKNSQIVVELPDGSRLDSFEVEPKFTSEGKWILVFRANPKLDSKK